MHYQLDELMTKIGNFLRKRPDGYLIVQVPESVKTVEFVYRPAGRRKRATPKMRVTVYEPDAAQRVAALRVGLPKPTQHLLHMRFGPQAGTIIPYLEYLAPVPPADEAAAKCLAVLREVFDASDDDWLWITDVYEPDDWPSPLPKPAQWPPG